MTLFLHWSSAPDGRFRRRQQRRSGRRSPDQATKAGHCFCRPIKTSGQPCFSYTVGWRAEAINGSAVVPPHFSGFFSRLCCPGQLCRFPQLFPSRRIERLRRMCNPRRRVVRRSPPKPSPIGQPFSCELPLCDTPSRCVKRQGGWKTVVPSNSALQLVGRSPCHSIMRRGRL
jgi:hypothetical protein